MSALEISALPAGSDNYIWLLTQADDDRAIVVDPGEARPVLEALEARNLALAAVFITHHHGDHVAGLEEVLARHPAPVFGPARESVAGVTEGVEGGHQVRVDGFPAAFDVFDTPGHTSGHVSYCGAGVLLCGDTLFAGGCGRIFEGTHAQMFESLQLLAGLPGDTIGCCGHEYTLANLAFARAVEPDNEAIAAREQRAGTARDQGRPTVPFRLAEEFETNPFLRCAEASVQRAAERHAGRELASELAVFAVLREWKDQF